MRKIIPSRPCRQSDDWRDRAPMPLALQIEREHGADIAEIERLARRAAALAFCTAANTESEQ